MSLVKPEQILNPKRLLIYNKVLGIKDTTSSLPDSVKNKSSSSMMSEKLVVKDNPQLQLILAEQLILRKAIDLTSTSEMWPEIV